MGNTDAAIDHLRRLVLQSPQFPDLHLRLANLLSTSGDDPAAAREFAEALRVHPDYLDCHIALAQHELRMGRPQGAVEHFHRAVTINNQNVEAYAGLAVALQRLGQTQQAGEMLASAAKIAGNSDVLVAQLGGLELQAQAGADAQQALTGQTPEAAKTATPQPMPRRWIEQQIARYEIILADHPGWTDVRVRYGMLLKLVNRIGEASAQFERITLENPACLEAWMQLALVKRANGDAAGALAAMETAIQIRPEYADLHYRLGLIYCSEMEFDLALERMEHAAELSGKNPDFQRHLWVVLQGLQLSGRTGNAARAAQRDQTLSRKPAA
jgi:tetratricopeptide (TPR) repeat protein